MKNELLQVLRIVPIRTKGNRRTLLPPQEQNQWKRIQKLQVSRSSMMLVSSYAHQRHAGKPEYYLKQSNKQRFREKFEPAKETYVARQFSKPTCKWAEKAKDCEGDSFETCDSDRASQHYHDEDPVYFQGKKLKVELCRNYVEKGYCPYETRCKFAHGVEELRARDTPGISELYRTRKCKVFFQKSECKFGERCNFIHETYKNNEIHESALRRLREGIKTNFLELAVEKSLIGEGESRLLKLLSHKSA